MYVRQVTLLAAWLSPQFVHFSVVFLSQSRVLCGSAQYIHFGLAWQLVVAWPHAWHVWHCTDRLLVLRRSKYTLVCVIYLICLCRLTRVTSFLVMSSISDLVLC